MLVTLYVLQPVAHINLNILVVNCFGYISLVLNDAWSVLLAFLMLTKIHLICLLALEIFPAEMERVEDSNDMPFPETEFREGCKL